MRIFLNEKEVVAKKGQTILEVCKTEGIEIPTLCHTDKLEPFTSCWLCIVKVKGVKGFVPSCATKIKEGMEIYTATPEIHSARKSCLELFFIKWSTFDRFRH